MLTHGVAQEAARAPQAASTRPHQERAWQDADHERETWATRIHENKEREQHQDGRERASQQALLWCTEDPDPRDTDIGPRAHLRYNGPAQVGRQAPSAAREDDPWAPPSAAAKNSQTASGGGGQAAASAKSPSPKAAPETSGASDAKWKRRATIEALWNKATAGAAPGYRAPFEGFWAACETALGRSDRCWATTQF